VCRLEAVYLLNTVVDQCTSEVFAQNCEHWVKALLTILQVFVRYIMYLNLHLVVLNIVCIYMFREKYSFYDKCNY